MIGLTVPGEINTST